jgi:hypothetical protein
MKTNIYALREDHFVQYVGKTKFPLEVRLADHLKEARRGGKNRKCNWIRRMLRQGFAPVITILEVAEGDGCKEEIAWIKYFRDYGIDLTNTAKGGEGGGCPGYKHTPEACARMKEGKKGWRCTWGDKISKTLMGHPGASKGEHRPPITVSRLKEAWVKRKASGWVSPRKGYKMPAEEKKKYILAWVKRKQNKG